VVVRGDGALKEPQQCRMELDAPKLVSTPGDE